MEVSRLLIDNGADISAADPAGTTPLHYAALFGCVEVARLLIDRGADTAAVDDFGLTPLGYAIWMGHVEVVRFLISRAAVHESGHTLLQTAFYGGHDAVLNYLLEMSARESQGSTALIEAGLHEDAAGLLFTGLINPNVDNQNVPTALGLAVSSGKLSLVQLLTNAGADPNLFNPYYGCPVQTAVALGRSDIVEFLLDAGAEQHTDEHGWSPSQCAQIVENPQMLQILGTKKKSSSASLPQPSSWSNKHKSPRLILANNGMDVMHRASPSKGRMIEPALVQANHPIRPSAGGFYFEITVINDGQVEESPIGIGLGTGFSYVTSFPGWSCGSWGYHSDDGMKFSGGGKWESYAETFRIGDVVGCGINNGEIYFTKNGRHLGIAYSGIVGRLFPIISLKCEGTHITTNFGDSGFCFKEANGLPGWAYFLLICRRVLARTGVLWLYITVVRILSVLATVARRGGGGKDFVE